MSAKVILKTHFIIFFFISTYYYVSITLFFSEIIEEQQCHDMEFRLTCRDLDTHIAVLEAWYTSIEDLQSIDNDTIDNNQTNQIQIDDALNQVYVYTSPKHNGIYQPSNRSLFENSLWKNRENVTFNLVNETFVDSVNETINSVNESLDSVNDTDISLVMSDPDECGVKGYLRSYASWKDGGRPERNSVRETSINLRAPLSYR